MKKLCPSCGFENLSEAHFCGQCGNNLKKLVITAALSEEGDVALANPLRRKFAGKRDEDLWVIAGKDADKYSWIIIAIAAEELQKRGYEIVWRTSDENSEVRLHSILKEKGLLARSDGK